MAEQIQNKLPKAAGIPFSDEIHPFPWKNHAPAEAQTTRRGHSRRRRRGAVFMAGQSTGEIEPKEADSAGLRLPAAGVRGLTG